MNVYCYNQTVQEIILYTLLNIENRIFRQKYENLFLN